MSNFVELVSFRVKAGVTPEQVISAAEQVNIFLEAQPGFLSRHLGVNEDGTWYDILVWVSQEHVLAAMGKAESSPHCPTFFGLIDPDHDNMALFPSLLSLEF